MSKRVRFAALLCLLALPLVACDGDDSTDGDRLEDILTLPGDTIVGEGVFEASCADAACHGPDGGTGASGVPLGDVIPYRTDPVLLEIMLLGADSMPPQDFDDQEAADVLAFVRDTFGH